MAKPEPTPDEPLITLGDQEHTTIREPLPHSLGDFTTTWRVVWLSFLAVFIGGVGAVLALVLLRLIGLFTNVFYFGRWDDTLVSPAGNHLGVFAVLVPVFGSLIVGLMARFGSERIRGHGIPEAIEAILITGSRIHPKVAILKPISSAIAIGTGGPFGAEGPIIMTAGAVGSMLAQFINLSSTERKTLLVAGAAAGMAATFGTPMAAMALAIELLLFEFKPRSAIPVAIACAVAAWIRRPLLGTGPLFAMKHHPPADISTWAMLSCVVVGILAGLLSIGLTEMVYAAEDGFLKLPIHWMWWPMIGGLVIGIGGLIYPHALGVGYDTIRLLLNGDATWSVIFGVLIVKSIIWSVSLGSGTSGGVLAPMLMMGGALGALAGHFLPAVTPGFWPLIGMAAILGGTMRVPFTAVFFALELTHEVNVLLPLLIATALAYGTTVLGMKRSILTEKVARRGFHLTREYTIDPLEVLAVQEVMRTDIVAFPQDLSRAQLQHIAEGVDRRRGQHLYPVLDKNRDLIGVVTRRHLREVLSHQDAEAAGSAPLRDLITPDPIVAYPEEPLRQVVMRMAETGLTAFPVVKHGNDRRLLGMVNFYDLLHARERELSEERHRQRWLRIRLFRPRPRPQSTEDNNQNKEPTVAV